MALPEICANCDKPIAQKRLGRPRLYCDNDKCRQAGHRSRNAQLPLYSDPVRQLDPDRPWWNPPRGPGGRRLKVTHQSNEDPS